MGFFVPVFQIVTWGRVSFEPRAIIWKNFVEVYKKKLYTKYQISSPSSFREEFWNFLSLFLCSKLWPLGQGQSWPQKHHMNKLGRDPQWNAAYQISKLYTFQFQRRSLKMGFFVPMYPIVTPGQGLFWPQRHHMNKLSRVHKEMLYTKYQSFRPSNFKEEFWNFLSLFSCSNLWPPSGRAFWPQGHYMNKTWKRSTRRCYIPNIKALGLTLWD